MQPLQSTTLKAFNALLAEQKQLNSAATRLTLMLFNHRCETVVDNHPWRRPQDDRNRIPTRRRNGPVGWHR